MSTPPSSSVTTLLHEALRALTVASAQVQLADRLLNAPKHSDGDVQRISEYVDSAGARIKETVAILRNLESRLADP